MNEWMNDAMNKMIKRWMMQNKIIKRWMMQWTILNTILGILHEDIHSTNLALTSYFSHHRSFDDPISLIIVIIVVEGGTCSWGREERCDTMTEVSLRGSSGGIKPEVSLRGSSGGIKRASHVQQSTHSVKKCSSRLFLYLNSYSYLIKENLGVTHSYTGILE